MQRTCGILIDVCVCICAFMMCAYVHVYVSNAHVSILLYWSAHLQSASGAHTCGAPAFRGRGISPTVPVDSDRYKH